MTADAGFGLGTRTIRGIAWAYGSYVGGRVLSLAATAILARLLVPEEFGIVALAVTLMALLDGVADLGLSQALLLQDRDTLHRRAETVFVAAIVLGAVLSATIVAISPLVSRFLDEPELVAIAAVLGANFFIRSLGATHYALAQKELDFRARTFAEVSSVAARGVVGIVLALVGFGAWSLVLGYLVGTAVLDLVIWWLVPWRPRLHPRLSDLREMIGFGGTLSAVDILATLQANADYVFIGRVLGATALGYYTLGFRLPELAIIGISVVAGRVLFPAFTALDRESLDRAFLVSLRYTVVLTLPLAAALAILADPVVAVAFGDQWGPTVTPMRILSIYALGITIGIPAGAAYKATGRAGVLLQLGIVRLALLIAGLVLFTGDGISAVAACQAAVAAFAAVAGIAIAARILAVRILQILDEVWPSAVATCGMAIALFTIDQLIANPLGSVLLAGTAGAVVYAGALWLLKREWIEYLRDRTLARAGGGDLVATRATTSQESDDRVIPGAVD